jgi:hypothetical protein
MVPAEYGPKHFALLFCKDKFHIFINSRESDLAIFLVEFMESLGKRLDPAGLLLTEQLTSFKVKNPTLLKQGQLRKYLYLSN